MKKRSFLLFILFFLIIPFSPGNVCPASLQAVAVVPDFEERSVILSVHGYACKKENTTLKGLRRRAISRAKIQILKQTKEYLDSRTNLNGVILKYEIVKNRFGHFVTVLDKKDYGIGHKGCCHVWIKGRVKYRLKDIETCKEDLMDQRAPLTVKVWTAKKEYKKGERVKVLVEGNRDFYGKVMIMDAEGKAVQVLPNNYRQISFFEKGKTYSIPGKGDKFNLEVSSPYGTERISVYASDCPLSLRNMKTIAGGIYQYRGKVSSFDRSIRASLSVTDNKIAEFYQGTREIVKIPR